MPEDLDAYIEDVRSEWRVAGLSIAAVKDGAVVYAKGFGGATLLSESAVHHTFETSSSILSYSVRTE